MSTFSSYQGSYPEDREVVEWIGTNGKYHMEGGRRVLNENPYWKHTMSHSSSKSHRGYAIDVGGTGAKGPIPANAKVQAQSNLVDAVRNHGFNMAKAGAEGKKTIDMAKKALKTCANVVRALKHGNLSGARRALAINGHTFTSRDVSGRWLELQYGWKPLLSDVHEAAKAYHALAGPVRSERVHASHHDGWPVIGPVSPSNVSGNGWCGRSYSYVHILTEALSTPRSLGLLDPVSVAWEMLPYSFVADWFIPIGTYLDNLSIIPQLKGITVETECRVISCTGMGKKTSYYYDGASAQFRDMEIYRRIYPTGVSAETPTFNTWPQALSPRHIFNAVALAHQRMGTSSN